MEAGPKAGPKTAAERKQAQRTRDALDPEALSKAKQLSVSQREEKREEQRKEKESKRAQQDADRKEIDSKRKRLERARSSEKSEV